MADLMMKYQKLDDFDLAKIGHIYLSEPSKRHDTGIILSKNGYFEMVDLMNEYIENYRNGHDLEETSKHLEKYNLLIAPNKIDFNGDKEVDECESQLSTEIGKGKYVLEYPKNADRKTKDAAIKEVNKLKDFADSCGVNLERSVNDLYIMPNKSMDQRVITPEPKL